MHYLLQVPKKFLNKQLGMYFGTHAHPFCKIILHIFIPNMLIKMTPASCKELLSEEAKVLSMFQLMKCIKKINRSTVR